MAFETVASIDSVIYGIQCYYIPGYSTQPQRFHLELSLCLPYYHVSLRQSFCVGHESTFSFCSLNPCWL
jgi:hypothetical protein